MPDTKNPEGPAKTERQPVQGNDPGTTLPVDPAKTPTVDEIHAKLPDDAPGAPIGDHEKDYADASREAALHPRHLPGLHRDEPGGALKPDDEHDPGINANVVS